MDFTQLQIFSSVAKHCSFAKAAEECYTSTTAISYHIKKLEEQFGVQLFIRNTHSVALTYAGKVCLDHTEKILDHYNYMIRDIRSLTHLSDSHIRIAYSGDWEKIVIPKIISRLHSADPNATVTLNHVHSHNLIPLLINEEADISFLTPFNYDMDSRITAVNVDSCPTCLVVNRDNPLANHKEADIESLKDQTFIVLCSGNKTSEGENIRHFWEKIHFKPNRKQIIMVDDTEQALLMLESNIGVSFLPKTLKRICSDQLRFLKIKDVKLSSNLRLAYKTDKRQYLDSFLKVVQEYVKKDIKLIS